MVCLRDNWIAAPFADHPHYLVGLARKRIQYTFDVRGTAATVFPPYFAPDSPVTISFIREGGTTLYSDTALFGVMAVKLAELKGFYQGDGMNLMPIVFTPVPNKENEFWGAISGDFIEEKSLGVIDIKTVMNSLGWTTFRLDSVVATGDPVVEAGIFTPQTANLPRDTAKSIKTWLTEKYSRTGYVIFNKSGTIDITVSGTGERIVEDVDGGTRTVA